MRFPYTKKEAAPVQPLPPPPVRRRSGFADEWRRFPATFTLIALNVLVFVYEQLLPPWRRKSFCSHGP